jgi:fructose-bisphosphate aldolase class 1
MSTKELISTAKAMLANNKGLLAMDEKIQPAIKDLQQQGFLKRRSSGVLNWKWR